MVGVKVYLFHVINGRDFDNLTFWILAISYTIIAAAGNIINDYFDVQTDTVNRPQKVIVGKYISRESALLFYFSLNSIAIFSAIYLSWIYHTFLFITIHVLTLALLFVYSYSLKKTTLLGNVVVSFLTAFVIYFVLLFFMQDGMSYQQLQNSVDSNFGLSPIVVVWSFIVVAFFQNLARELIKDVEDVIGDKKIEAKTFPIVFGNSITVKLVGLISLLFPFAYLFFLLYNDLQINWIQLLPISIAASINLFIAVLAFTQKSQKSVLIIKGMLKLTLFFGIIYLFIAS